MRVMHVLLVIVHHYLIAGQDIVHKNTPFESLAGNKQLALSTLYSCGSVYINCCDVVMLLCRYVIILLCYYVVMLLCCYAVNVTIVVTIALAERLLLGPFFGKICTTVKAPVH